MLKKVLLFYLVLCLPSLASAQEFNFNNDSVDYYPSFGVDAYIPLRDGQAILKYVVKPHTSITHQSVVLSADIVPSFKYHQGVQLSALGWQVLDLDNDTRILYSVIDASNIYFLGRTNAPQQALFSQVQDILLSKNLGTVQQRAALIRGFHSVPVQILDIDNFKKSILNALSPFLNIYLGIFLTLFVVDLMSKKSKDVIAESAKIQRRAERAQQRREIRADPTAQIFEFRLANFSSIASGSVSDPSISRRKARRLFEDTAMEYAEYKKSRGWKY